MVCACACVRVAPETPVLYMTTSHLCTLRTQTCTHMRMPLVHLAPGAPSTRQKKHSPQQPQQPHSPQQPHGSQRAGGRLLGAHVRVDLLALLRTEGELGLLLLVAPRL